MNMSYSNRKEYLEVLRTRYTKASSRLEKSQVIDEAVHTLGYHRKHVIRELNRVASKKSKSKNRQKPMRYSEALPTIELVWAALDYPCAERLHPVLYSTARSLEKHGECRLTPTVLSQLQQISRTTLGRYIGRMESPKAKRRMPRHKPSSGITSDVPIDRYDWDEQKPGALEIDLVEHNGGNSHGHYAYTLTVVDIVSGYSRRYAVLGRSQAAVLGAIQHLLDDWPFQPWGLHSDNGSEFLNDQLVKFCRSNDFDFSRSRAYKKNDNAHVEQKNRQYVRDFVGYERYDTAEEVEWLNDVYEHVDIYANLILPMRKIVSKERQGKKLKKGYDEARTPFRRLIELGAMTDTTQQQLQDIVDYINPLALHRTISNLLAVGPIKQSEEKATKITK